MIGFRVCERKAVVPEEMIAAFREIPVANASDVMSRMTGGGADLRPRHAGGRLSGAALTVKTRPGDNLMIHKAIDMAGPGDVVIVDAGADNTNSLVGELMIAHATKRGLAGLVLNGAIRDAAWIAAQDMPVFSTGITHRGPYKDGPGEVNVAIAIAGMVVEPGDLVLGDDDGVLAIPREQAGDVLAAARKKAAAEEKQMNETLAGTLDRSWVDRVLKERNCVFENERQPTGVEER